MKDTVQPSKQIDVTVSISYSFLVAKARGQDASAEMIQWNSSYSADGHN